MPDWSYKTLFQPLLQKLPARQASNLTLGAFGTLGRFRLGSFVIRTMGHMELSPLLSSKIRDVKLPYPVGLSGLIDQEGKAQRSLSQIGFGFMEVGPIQLKAHQEESVIELLPDQEAIVYTDIPVISAAEVRAGYPPSLVDKLPPLMCRLRHQRGRSIHDAVSDYKQLMNELSDIASGFYIDAMDPNWSLDEQRFLYDELAVMIQKQYPDHLRWIYVPLGLEEQSFGTLWESELDHIWDGCVIGEGVWKQSRFHVGPDDLESSLNMVRWLKPKLQAEQKLIISGGIHEPQGALKALAHGADYVQLHSGLVYSGPGLPKRINEAILFERMQFGKAVEPSSFWSGWGWMWLLGLGMVIGGIIAWWIAATTVLLPYDEAFLNMTRKQLQGIFPQLIDFMAHDRITLAGTMISIGVLYMYLARYSLRYELHWAKTALMSSGIVGFSSFFLYLGYGYFDPLHALAAAVLLPLFMMAMRGKADQPLRHRPNLVNNRIWKRALWGQLCFVTLGISFAAGGIIIAGVGITGVFVPQDLAFLCLSPESIAMLNDKLLPLIAHDRAGFGGALLCDAIALLATALWGIQQGERWIWNMLLWGGLPGFIAGFGVHYAIGYLSFIHLLPAYFAAALYIIGLILLYPYLKQKPDTDY